MAEVLVLAEHEGGEVKKVTVELLTAARRLGEPSVVWVGAGAEEGKARLAEFGAGWIPWGAAADDTAQGIRQMGHLLSELGKDMKTIQVVGTLPITTVDGRVDVSTTMAPVGELLDAGVTDFRMSVRMPTGRSEAVDLLSPIVQGFRAAVG